MEIKPQTVILSVACFPPAQWFAAFLASENCFVETFETYQKQSYRNRYEIATANGKQVLSISVSHDLKRGDIRSVEMDAKASWQKLHWRTIESAYRKAPFFEYYAHDIEPFFRLPQRRLFSFNLEVIEQCLRLMRITKGLKTTDSFLPYYPAEIHDLRQKIHPKKPPFIVFPGEYRQVFSERHGFIPGLSILDVLFNLGPDSADYLSKGGISGFRE